MATIRDVAKRAGVSVSTASLALNGRPLVSEETQRKVLRAARELDYHPNEVARSLADGRTRTLALFIPVTLEHLFSSAGFFGGLLKGMHRAALQQEYHLSLHVVESEEETAERVRAIVHSKRSDGLIITNPTVHPPYLNDLRKAAIPVVFVGRPQESDFAFVDNDNIEVGRLGVRQLAANGHRRIALLNGPRRFTFSQDRLEGYRKEILEIGLDLDDDLIWSSDLSEENAYSTVSAAFRSGKTFSAIFCASDIQAVGALRALRDLSLKVPDDIAILAVNNTALTRYYVPPIATIDLHEEQLGYLSVKLLLRQIIGEQSARNISDLQVKVPSSLVPRASCGCTPDSLTVDPEIGKGGGGSR